MSKTEIKAYKQTIAFIVAICVRLGTKAISPIHEIFHGILAVIQGQTITAVSWNYIEIARCTPLTTGGAYFLELIFYAIIVMKAKRSTFSMFCFGILHALALRAPVSMDFRDLPGMWANWLLLWVVTVAVCWWVVVHKYKMAPE